MNDQSHPLPASSPLAVTIREAADLLHLDPRTVRAMFHAGEIAGNQRGHAIRLSRASVLEWLGGRRQTSAEANTGRRP